MAKRSDRRQRRAAAAPPRGGAAAPRPDAVPPGAMWRTSAFWLGGLVVGLAVAAIAVAAIVLLGGDDKTPATPAAATPAADGGIKSAEQLEQEFADRDRQQIEELTNEARAIAETLQPVMAGLDKALPRSGGPVEQVA